MLEADDERKWAALVDTTGIHEYSNIHSYMQTFKHSYMKNFIHALFLFKKRICLLVMHVLLLLTFVVKYYFNVVVIVEYNKVSSWRGMMSCLWKRPHATPAGSPNESNESGPTDDNNRDGATTHNSDVTKNGSNNNNFKTNVSKVGVGFCVPSKKRTAIFLTITIDLDML